MIDIVFLDTETLGLDIEAPIWEFAAIRRDAEGIETEEHFFIRHNPYPWLDSMPEQFAEDYVKRFDPLRAVSNIEAVRRIYHITREAHIIGAVPNFDTERIQRLFKRVHIPCKCQETNPNHPDECRHFYVPEWHYHLIDCENLAVGYLAAKGQLMQPPWKSDELSKAIGVDPEQFPRHTAMGDVEWVRAQWDVIMSGR